MTTEGAEKPSEAWDVQCVACFYYITVELVDSGTDALDFDLTFVTKDCVLVGETAAVCKNSIVVMPVVSSS